VTDSDGVEALRQVAAALLAAQGRIDAIEAEEASIEEELAALDAEVEAARVGDNEGDPGEETTPDDDSVGTGDNGGEEGGTTHPAGEPPAQPSGETEERVAAGTPSAPNLGALGRTPRRQAPTQEDPAPVTRIVASGNFVGAPAGTEVTPDLLGLELQRQHRAMQTLTPDQLPRDAQGRILAKAGGRKVVLATLPIIDRPGVVHLQKGDGSEVIDQAVTDFVRDRDARLAENERLVASGGDCVMALPDYSINLIGERGTCFTDDLPTVAGNRPLAYYPWFKINQAWGATGRGTRPAGGIGFVTSEEDAAGYGNPDAEVGAPDEIPEGGVPYKDCIHIDCPDEPLECSQEAVYKCVTLGNFQAISHPEYVAAWQQYMDIWFDIERDERALSSFVAEATAQNHLLTANELEFGAIASLKDIFHRLLAKERSARHSPNLSFNVVAPDWFGGFLAKDVLLHSFGSIDNLRATPAQAMALASTDGIRMSTYCTDVGATQTTNRRMVLPPITTGAVPAWPDTVRLLMYPDGAVFKKTAGDLQVGLRETLIKTNDFGMFQESFEKVCYRGDVYVLDVRLCANGSTGAPVAITCT
jgi:hypothetical protein